MFGHCNVQVASFRVTVTIGCLQGLNLEIIASFCLSERTAAACCYKSCYKSYQSVRYAPVWGELPSTKFILRLFKFLLCIIHFFCHPLEHNINGWIQQCCSQLSCSLSLGLLYLCNLVLQGKKEKCLRGMDMILVRPTLLKLQWLPYEDLGTYGTQFLRTKLLQANRVDPQYNNSTSRFCC